MWPWNWIERNLFEIPDDKITVLLGEYVGIVGIGIDLNPTGNFASPQSEVVALEVSEQNYWCPNSFIVLTSGYRVKGGLYSEAEAMGRYMDFKDADIFLTEGVKHTHEEVKSVIEILHMQGCKKAIVIGQQLHLRRIRALFRKIGADSGIKFFFVKARSEYGGGSQWRLWCFPFFLVWEMMCFTWLKLRGIL